MVPGFNSVLTELLIRRSRLSGKALCGLASRVEPFLTPWIFKTSLSRVSQLLSMQPGDI
jgi:hypothetical protein